MLNMEIGDDGDVVGFDIDHASQRLDLHTLESGAFPLNSIRAS